MTSFSNEAAAAHPFDRLTFDPVGRCLVRFDITFDTVTLAMGAMCDEGIRSETVERDDRLPQSKAAAIATDLTVDDLKRAVDNTTPQARLPGRNRTKATILLYRLDGVDLAVKDYGGSPFLVRQLLGRWLIRREVRALEATAGLVGLPQSYGRWGPFRLVTGWIESKPFARCATNELPKDWSSQLREIVASLHRRGIALGDLHHRDVLIATDGSVHVVDLATAWLLGPRPGLWRRWLFERLRTQDQIAITRIEARSDGRDPDAAVAALDPKLTRWYLRSRRLKRMLRR